MGSTILSHYEWSGSDTSKLPAKLSSSTTTTLPRISTSTTTTRISSTTTTRISSTTTTISTTTATYLSCTTTTTRLSCTATWLCSTNTHLPTWLPTTFLLYQPSPCSYTGEGGGEEQT